nr:hypothetical protein B0A51_18765 [Rachicladosporium sp. CCFEE 5018]
MLDENLPAFFLKQAADGIKHHYAFNLSYHGSDPEPAYLLQHADPASPSPEHKNCYAAALFDAFNPDVLFGEVLARPQWTQPTLSQEEVRRNGGVPPPPQPILPREFTAQLYNPDQQILCSVKEGKWGSSDTYEFSMPETSFRAPSASMLDRSQSDPATLPVTAKINFSWRKESKLGKDLTCFMTGKSTDTEKKKSRRDPDIAIALWRSLRELTIYEPNLSRVDIEDPKGLEVVLLLSAVVIKDLYFSSRDHMAELFNVTSAPLRKLSAGGRRVSNPAQTPLLNGSPNPLISHPPPPQAPHRTSFQQQRPQHEFPAPPPMPDPRAAWQLEAETARLRAQAEAESRAAAQERRSREKADEAAAKALQKQMENEDREAKRKQAEVNRETERLRKKYGVQPIPPPMGARMSGGAGPGGGSRQRLQSVPQGVGVTLMPPQQIPQRLGPNGLYMNSAASSSAVGMGLRPDGGNAARKKKSFFGLRGVSEEEQPRKLAKKSSAMW